MFSKEKKCFDLYKKFEKIKRYDYDTLRFVLYADGSGCIEETSYPIREVVQWNSLNQCIQRLTIALRTGEYIVDIVDGIEK